MRVKLLVTFVVLVLLGIGIALVPRGVEAQTARDSCETGCVFDHGAAVSHCRADLKAGLGICMRDSADDMTDCLTECRAGCVVIDPGQLQCIRLCIEGDVPIDVNGICTCVTPCP